MLCLLDLILNVTCRLKHKRRKSETEPSRSDPSALRFGGFLQVFLRVLPTSKAVFVYSSAVYRNFFKGGKVVALRNKEGQAQMDVNEVQLDNFQGVNALLCPFPSPKRLAAGVVWLKL